MTLEELIDEIERGRVIPVIGNELCFLKDVNGDLTYVDAFIAGRLAGKVKMTYSGERLQTIAASKDAQDSGVYKRIRDIYGDIEKGSIYPDYSFSSEIFDQLVSIEGFTIFLTVSFSDLLEKSLKRARGENNVQVINYSLSRAEEGKIQKNELFEIDESKSVIINLLGSVKGNNEFAVTEEEYIEYFFHIISVSEGLFALSRKLINRMKESSFLYLGCSFPDWYARYIVRGITQKRYVEHKVLENIFIDEYTSNTPVVRDFFSSHKSDVLDDIKMNQAFNNLGAGLIANGKNRADKFIHTLSNAIRFKKKNPTLYEGKIFICYYGVDREAVAAIGNRIRLGRMDTWIDVTDLPAGQHNPQILEKLSSCKVFLPVISSALIEKMAEIEAAKVAKTHNPDIVVPEEPYCIREEWTGIIERVNMEKYFKRINQPDKIVPFTIVPCILDNVNKQDPHLPEIFRASTAFDYPAQSDRLLEALQALLIKPVAL